MSSQGNKQVEFAFEEVMQTLESLGSDQTRKIWRNHGAKEPMFGVKVGDMKKHLVNRHTRNNTALALELYNTGNCDAMYLAGLITNPQEMSKKQINEWAKQASWYMVSEYTVASVCARSRYALELSHKWIADKNRKNVCSSGWSGYSHYIALSSDRSSDLSSDLSSDMSSDRSKGMSEEYDAMRAYLDFCKNEIHNQRNRVKYTMNGFVISVGAYIPALKDEALATARLMGKVEVYMGKTSCKVPDAYEYIEKIWKRKK